jgi:tetratricopeptide (TPR) repeat protein
MFGCSAPGGNRNMFINNDYQKILAVQGQKISTMAKEEISNKIPEMTEKDHEKQGDRYIRQGNINKAFIQYNKALYLDPKQNDIRYKIGILLLSKEMIDDGLKEFEKILENDLNNALAYDGKGRAFFAKDELDKSKKNFEKALNINPDLWQDHMFLGVIYDCRKQFDAAISEYSKAIAIKPESGALYTNLGMSYYLKGEYEKSVNALIKASKMKPVNPITYNNLGLSLSKLGRYRDAFEAFKKGGDNASAYNNIGYMYMKNGRYKEAIQAFKKAIEIKPYFYTKANEKLKKAKEFLYPVPQKGGCELFDFE